MLEDIFIWIKRFLQFDDSDYAYNYKQVESFIKNSNIQTSFKDNNNLIEEIRLDKINS